MAKCAGAVQPYATVRIVGHRYQQFGSRYLSGGMDMVKRMAVNETYG